MEIHSYNIAFHTVNVVSHSIIIKIEFVLLGEGLD